MKQHFWRLLTLLMLVLAVQPLSHPAQAQEAAPFLPSDLQIITANNAAQLEQVGIFGHGLISGGSWWPDHALAWSSDGQNIAVAGTVGIWLFNANDLQQ